jgi:autoinducer 2 (AI-2) kinase
MESVCCYLAQVYFTGCPEENRAKVMHAVGGGACSGEWMQMLADILGVTVRVPEAPRHVGAVGTAISALVGLGVFQSFEDARARRKIQKTYVPNEALRQVYREALERYGQLMAQ